MMNLTERPFDVYGLGNALVDRVVNVTEAELQALNIDKGVMTLIDESTASAMTAQLADFSPRRVCGGSGANTLIALAQLGGKGFYNCCVANDDDGLFYLAALNTAGLASQLDPKALPTGKTGNCFAFITPDIQRSMQTYLGIGAELSEQDLSLEMIPKAKYLYIEGYLAAQPQATKAVIAAYQAAKQHGTRIAITLSDPNMVTYCKANLLAMLGEGVDLLFCNEAEACLFAQTQDLNVAVATLRTYAKQFVITLGAKGALLYDGRHCQQIDSEPVNAIDSLGAGDMFAGAFLYAVTQNYSLESATRIANDAAGCIVTKVGARLDQAEIDRLRANLPISEIA